ncbi:hypothetical protein [Streptomyces brasiliensis]|uniref:TetR family transcriptional regulator n=1 Tax=Streptomyces brasiliensis TaxID=1954 RepID=A0A917P5N5_9ACTN|nr:hypothetical protein [Streptomyces brasiliensis]GGJ62943.1 hypothetical protein GCM10010121_087030 [Streptomyces brasiliensis]
MTRTSKSQLFHHFPGGKEELFLEVARFEADLVLEDPQPYLGALDSWAAWGRWRKAVIARYKAQGPHCPLASLMTQVSSIPGAAEVAMRCRIPLAVTDSRSRRDGPPSARRAAVAADAMTTQAQHPGTGMKALVGGSACWDPSGRCACQVQLRLRRRWAG